jgi:glycosyltransferase involved in cell wall biosynthesis
MLYIATTWLSPHGLRVPTVTSVHDIQQFHFPNFFSLKEKWIRSTLYDSTIKNSDFIQASSKFIQKDLLDCYPGMISLERIVVIPEGVDVQTFAENSSSQDLNLRYGLPDEFLLYPAQLWPHKNHIRLFQALRQITRLYSCTIPLVLTGTAYKASRTIFNYIETQQLRSQIHYLGKVPLEDLLGLYKLSKYLVMPVLYESSSLPILEAAASGTSILASAIPPNQEMAERLKMHFFDPLDVSSMAEVIHLAWKEREDNEETKHQNLKAVQYYSWENIAKKYLSFFQKMLDEKKYKTVFGI